jgi:transcription antitermination factor NusG
LGNFTVFDHSSPAGLHEPNWFALFVRSNQEKQTARRLADFEIEHFFPCYRSVRQWKDRRVTLDMPLFPGYLFVRLPFIERSRVLTLPNVVSLVGSKSSPAIISEEEIHWIRRGVELGGAEPHPYLSAGQRVIITAGVLCGMRGVLVRKQNNSRVVVSLDSISRSFVVEVSIDQVAPLTTELPAYKQAV